MSEWDDIQEEIDAAAAWDQQQQDERRRQEDEALERHRRLLEEFRREVAAHNAEMKQYFERIRQCHFT